MKFALKIVTAGVLVASATGAFAQKGETVKVAWLDPLSGLMAAVGTNQLKTLQFFAEKLNEKNPAGVKFEVIAIDNKLSPQETTVALRSAMDQGARYILQGNGSGPALAIIDALEKNNARNPGKEALYLNYAAVDPDLTNSKCSYWQYRFDADTSMKMEALTTFIKEQPDVKKVYLLNQNYSHGQQVSKFAKENLKVKRPDIEIVGDDLHPLAQVRDFAPYIAKIKQSGADSVITGNWGSDLALLIKAANDSGLNVKFFTYYAVTTGTPTAMGAASDGKVYQVGYAHYNMGGQMQKWADEYKKRFNDDMYTTDLYTVLLALSEAMARSKSTDVLKVAQTMEGMKFTSYNGDMELRKADHQMQQGLYITRWEKASAKYPYSPENTGYTLAPVKYYEAYVASTPTTCQMKRPGG
ncbi:branched-chain amino acid ABC transporter substrate-binding protein [Variovorax dokdonensis]|uniref:Branched-chain amino acid ABC transporter substrate-binding protein n=1 Tax=Variovorax dokdonensis TaxID=344883 RepID=A0ABT7NH06_9BURK|nr:branched-chain amino acid ABC transporter substrate-binding protein [Variovorax dokdonensis]MDM0047185.1 branched-chain amino acid ABC transporter substrate-binding protein [Variovorax dokdonensis]